MTYILLFILFDVCFVFSILISIHPIYRKFCLDRSRVQRGFLVYKTCFRGNLLSSTQRSSNACDMIHSRKCLKALEIVYIIVTGPLMCVGKGKKKR